jgi:hypothetical protein
MHDSNDLIMNSVRPEKELERWLTSAKDIVECIIHNLESNDVILLGHIADTYIWSSLIRKKRSGPFDLRKLQGVRIEPSSITGFNFISGGGKPDCVEFEDAGNKEISELGIVLESLVFRRRFEGVDKGPSRTEVSQKFIHALNLYWMDEYKGYCALNEDGDIERIVKVDSIDHRGADAGDYLVTVKREFLHKYMAVTESSLLTRFDVTRFSRDHFAGWDQAERGEISKRNVYYNWGVQARGSYIHGGIITRPGMNKKSMVSMFFNGVRGVNKKYTSFIAQDWKNNKIRAISCNPNKLSSYFDKNSKLPFQVTPVFFKSEVLTRYKSDPEKYTLQDRSISSRSGWHLRTYDVNDAGQVHTYICYLGDLPYGEQIYWKSFNERPRAAISRRAYKNDFMGQFSDDYDPIRSIKSQIERLDKESPEYWIPRDDRIRSMVHYPHTKSTEEWANAILLLDQLVVEGFQPKWIKRALEARGIKYDKQWQSLRLLEELMAAGAPNEDSGREMLEPLRSLHFLRTKVKGHAAQSEKDKIVKDAIAKYGALSRHFRQISAKIDSSLKKIVYYLNEFSKKSIYKS